MNNSKIHVDQKLIYLAVYDLIENKKFVVNEKFNSKSKAHLEVPKN